MSGFKKYKPKFSWKKYKRSYKHILKKNKILLRIIALFTLFVLLFFLLSLYRSQDKFLITRVVYPKDIISIYNDSIFYSKIKENYINTYYSSPSSYSRVIKSLKLKYPFLDTIKVQSFENNTILLDPVFIEPLVVLHRDKKRFALYDDLILPLLSGNDLGRSALDLYLPQYLFSGDSLSGVLYDQESIDILAQDIISIKNTPLSGIVVYIPGGEKYVYASERQFVYFNAKKDIGPQVQQLLDLYYNYEEFQNLTRIDIGSIDYPIVQ